MIYCVWYPSGGFGHFVNAVLTLHGENFVRPKKQLVFSRNGNSHSLDLVTPKYLHGHWTKEMEFQIDKNYCVLIDNGINNESEQFKLVFPDSTVIKICYTDHSWPVVAYAMINKAMNSTLNEQLPLDHWNTTQSWTLREKYFLFLRDHDLRHAWRPNNHNAIHIEDLYDNYNKFLTTLDSFAKIEWCENLWSKWRTVNSKYIDPVTTAQSVLDHVTKKSFADLTHITDIWTQAVIYYYIWLHFGIEVPHNNFAGFFSNTKQIAELVA